MSLSYLRSILVTIPEIAIATILCGSASMIASFFDATGNSQHKIARFWSRVLLAVSRVRVEVEGVERLDPNRSYVLVANHSSYMDTPVVLGNVPLQFRFFAKKGLFSIPFLGTHLKRAGHVPVVRGDPRASLKNMTEGARLIQSRHVSVLLFPEGGRSVGAMREFKEGAAYVAIKAGVPIVPIGIGGTRKILPMGSGNILPGLVTLRVGEPIETCGLKLQDRRALTQKLRQRVAELSGEAARAAC